MPPAPVDPDRLLSLGRALEPWRECARTGADDALAHLVETGDRETQSALDDYLETVADLLRAIDDSAADLSARLAIAGGGGRSSRAVDAPRLADAAAQRSRTPR